jgi:hypothetical protein
VEKSASMESTPGALKEPSPDGQTVNGGWVKKQVGR